MDNDDCAGAAAAVCGVGNMTLRCRGYSFNAVTTSVSHDFEVIGNLTVVTIKILSERGESFPVGKLANLVRDEIEQEKQTPFDGLET